MKHIDPRGDEKSVRYRFNVRKFILMQATWW